MANVSKNASEEVMRITYSGLNQALTTLGFVRKETKDFTAYREAAHDALIVLPNMSADSDVGDPHLVTVRNTVTGKGIATLDGFQTLLVNLPTKPTTSKLRSQTARRPFVKPRKPGVKAHSQQPAPVEKTSRKSSVKKRFSPASA